VGTFFLAKEIGGKMRLSKRPVKLWLREDFALGDCDAVKRRQQAGKRRLSLPDTIDRHDLNLSARNTS
jgi:hypothetical protein